MVTINPMQLRNRNKTATQTSLEPTLNSEDSFKTRRVKEKSDFPIILSLSLAAFLIRIYNIYSPSQIVFDEVTFGSHISNYINGQFFIDIHPPLAKLLFSLVAWLFGYNGEFKFDAIGSSYTQDVPYTALRMLASIFGVFTVPLSYISLRNMGTNVLPAILASMFLMFENGLITQSRFILLDSILVFFTCFTLAMWTEFITYKNHEFSPPWWNSLILTGVGLGLTVSVKWIGLFAIATVGLFTLGNLWNIIDAKITMKKFTAHFLARTFALIVIPILVYMTVFQVHFMMLPNKGSGGDYMSPEFQQTFNTDKSVETFADVGYNSHILIKHSGTRGGYLHSHKDTYPAGSKQQQITLYGWSDDNSIFIVRPAIQDKDGALSEVSLNETSFTKITDGTVVRLQHLTTKKYLHSHNVRAPVSTNGYYNEVSGYGGSDFIGDTNDNWIVKVDGGGDLQAVVSRVRFLHQRTRCELFSHEVKLPDWGFYQQEVACAIKGNKRLTSWRIEGNLNKLLDHNARKAKYRRIGFLRKLYEMHSVMLDVTGSEFHPASSRPGSWLFLRRGVSYWTSDKLGQKIYLIGNPFVWILASLSLVAYLGLNFILAVLKQRRIVVKESDYISNLNSWGFLMFIGWAVHYFPFFALKRQLFLYHYFPALYFSILCFSLCFDALTRSRNRIVVLSAFFTFAFGAVVYFLRVSPVTYGLTISKSQCESLKVFKSWDFDCSKF